VITLSGKPVWSQERERYADKMRKRGTPLLVTQAEFAAAARLLDKARRYGMSDSMIGEQAGVPDSLPGKVRRGKIKTMHRDSFEKVMSLRPERPKATWSEKRGKVGAGPYVESTGTVRRIQALRADGFPGWLLGEHLGVTYEAVAQLARSQRKVVMRTTRASVAKLYAELEGKTPQDFGVGSPRAGKCATYARRAGFVPRSCWDSDTIDDPAARPEWTGRCGTVFGWHIHQTEGIPACQPCIDARDSGSAVFSGSRFRELRERAGLSRARLAEQIGVNPVTIQYWESGRNLPTRKNKLDLALRVLDATFEEVCE
jgi:DNA-binding XRE family transcriptional regulator